MNLRGVGFGAGLNTVLTAAKLVPMLLFIGVGLFHLDGARFEPFAPQGYSNLGETTVLVLFAYVGFEGLVIPAAEMRDPQRSVPIALLSGMATIVLLYLGIWAVCTGTLPGLATATSPVGDAAAEFLPSVGASVVQIGVVISVLGINAFMALVTPRMLYAMSHAGLLPRWFGGVNERRVPSRAIWVTSLSVLALALIGTFEALALVSVVARIAQYVPTCGAVLRMRVMRDVPAARFRVPFGPVLPLLAVAVCAWLLIETPTEELLWGGVILGAGTAIYAPWRALR
jgi:amino acid transporter